MTPAFHDSAMLDHENLIGPAESREAVRDDERGAAPISRSRASRMTASVFESTAGRLVEDQDGGALEKRPREEIRCRSPPDSFTPRSPTWVSYRSGSVMMN